MILCELRNAVTMLRGTGRSRAALLGRLGITTIADLLLNPPRAYEDRTTVVPLIEAAARTANTGGALVRVTVVDHSFIPTAPTRNAPLGTLKVQIADHSTTGSLVCFGRNFLAQKLPIGKEIFVWGQFRFEYKETQTAQFEFESVDAPKLVGTVVPVYSLTEGLTQGTMRALSAQAVHAYAENLADELPAAMREEEQLPSKAAALRALHLPQNRTDPEGARVRLAFEELLVFQLRLARLAAVNRARVERPAANGTSPQSLRERVTAALPFALTADQVRAIAEIEADLHQPRQMVRLLQGDVGCGKTLVALLSACVAIERGEQVALMVPTELLAYQHARNAAALLRPHGVEVALLIGGMKPQARRLAGEAVRTGAVQLVIGTHALFSQALQYDRLGYVIIDEQHRFGVAQRAFLAAKGEAPDTLLMSATPIPRTLALTAFGDAEITAIRTLPAGRRPITTHLTRIGNEENVYSRVERELDAGRQAYFVYPLIEGDADTRDAVRMAGVLAARFPRARVELVHGRIDEQERDTIMAAFSANEIQVLVATTVVEVGVDVPNATCMVVEHAERFGLAALHQLRGRVGRGVHPSSCYLIYDPELTDDAKERLRVLHTTTDGFEIAEQDLRLRGPGELAGARQSGFQRFRFADLARDLPLLERARRHAARIVGDDPGLLLPAHSGLRVAVRCADEAEQAVEEDR